MCIRKYFLDTKEKLINIIYNISTKLLYLNIYCILQCRSDVIFVPESELPFPFLCKVFLQECATFTT